MDVAHLPRQTRFVARTDLARAIADREAMRPEDVPNEALWTALAERLCGGYDLHRLLMSAASDAGRAAAASTSITRAPARAAATAADTPAVPPPTTKTSVSWRTGVRRACSAIQSTTRGLYRVGELPKHEEAEGPRHRLGRPHPVALSLPDRGAG